MRAMKLSRPLLAVYFEAQVKRSKMEVSGEPLLRLKETSQFNAPAGVLERSAIYIERAGVVKMVK